MAIKIENYIGSADTFTWPNNPNVFDADMVSNHSITKITYQKHHIVISGGGIEPKGIVLTGQFNGANKRVNYRSMTRHFQETTLLKKLYWETDKFYLGIGKQAKETNSGGRTNFVDYVATFETILGILLDDTEDTSGTNDGNVTTFVTEIIGTVTNGAANITITDNIGNSISIPLAILTTSQNFLYRLVQMVDSGSGIFVSEYAFVALEVDAGTTTSTTANKLVQSGQNFSSTVNVGDIVRNTSDGTDTRVTAVDSNTVLSLADDIMETGEDFIIYSQTRRVTTTGGFGILQLKAGANITTVVTTNLSSVTKKYRDGWSA